MDNKKLSELMQDKEFVEKILEAATEEEVKKLFSEKGIELLKGDLDFLAKVIAKAYENKGNLSEKDLESITGGGFSFTVDSTPDFFKGTAAGLALGAALAVGLGTWAYKKGIDYARDFWWAAPSKKPEVQVIAKA